MSIFQKSFQNYRKICCTKFKCGGIHNMHTLSLAPPTGRLESSNHQLFKTGHNSDLIINFWRFQTAVSEIHLWRGEEFHRGRVGVVWVESFFYSPQNSGGSGDLTICAVMFEYVLVRRATWSWMMLCREKWCPKMWVMEESMEQKLKADTGALCTDM